MFTISNKLKIILRNVLLLAFPILKIAIPLDAKKHGLKSLFVRWLLRPKSKYKFATINASGNKIDEIINYMKKNRIDLLCAQEMMNMDNSFFWRDGIAIITASNLNIKDKGKLKEAKGTGKGRNNKGSENSTIKAEEKSLNKVKQI